MITRRRHQDHLRPQRLLDLHRQRYPHLSLYRLYRQHCQQERHLVEQHHLRHHRERRSRGIAIVAPVEVGEGGIELLVGNGLLKQHQIADRKAVGEACLAALEQWAEGRGARSTGQG